MNLTNINDSISTSPTIIEETTIGVDFNNSEIMENIINNNREGCNFQDFYFVLPCIIMFGLIGNILSLVTILQSRLRKTNASAYLIVLTSSDSIFLIILLLVLFQVDFYSYYSCTLIEYLLSTSASVSSWSIAALTIERFSAIVYPLKHVTYGHIDRFKMIMFWLPIPFLYNLIYFAGLESNDLVDERKCKITEGVNGSILTIIDIALNYIFPCVTVVALNFFIASNIGATSNYFINHPNINENNTFIQEKKKNKRQCSKQQAQSNYSKLNNNSSTYSSRKSFANGKKSTGTTRILWVVPFVYIILNTPYYTLQIIDRISEGAVTTYFLHSKNPLFILFNNILLYLYYFNFASDVLVYAFSSKMFRKTVISVWKKLTCYRLCMRNDTNNEVTNYTLAPRRHPTEINTSGFNTLRKDNNPPSNDIHFEKYNCRLKIKNYN
uniref:G_PROTEIN_RECEP_F1_2 domain-containing protein n=1 Tax=Parastrongyloides trichosuri TaxID=131310 RepID=A0A0N4ZYA6_PARTI